MARPADRPTYIVDRDALRRFDEWNTAFGLSARDPEFILKEEFPAGRGAVAGHDEVIDEHARALSRAAHAVRAKLGEAFFGLRECEGNAAGDHGDPAANAALIKAAALRFGADLVGICALDRMWLYSHNESNGTPDVPEACKSAVVMAVAMDTKAVRQSPGSAAEAATRIGYMKAAVCASAMGLFIRDLGYNAIATDNGVGLSIPLAMDAGLGEMGRHAMLIAADHGPCVRICKVLTDLPLEPDKPVDTGITKFCQGCRQCVEACPARAIDDSPERHFETRGEFNRPGVCSWPVDARRCLSFWRHNGGNCSNCIAACPFTPRV